MGGKDNAIKPGTDIVRELTVKKLRELAGRDLSMAKYPLYCYFDEPRHLTPSRVPTRELNPLSRFQFANLSGIESINNEALKELSLK